MKTVVITGSARGLDLEMAKGIDDEYINIAESLLKCVKIEKLSYVDKNSKLYRLYGYINTLDDFYVAKGNYENMW